MEYSLAREESELTERLTELFSALLGHPVQASERTTRTSHFAPERFGPSVTRPEPVPVARPQPVPVTRPEPTTRTQESFSVPEGYVVVGDCNITPEIRSAVNLFNKMGFDTVEVIRPSADSRRTETASDNNSEREKMSSVLEELLRTTSSKNRDTCEDDDDLPDLVSDEDDEDSEEESPKDSSKTTTNTSEKSELSDLDYHQLLALETIIPGVLQIAESQRR